MSVHVNTKQLESPSAPAQELLGVYWGGGIKFNPLKLTKMCP